MAAAKKTAKPVAVATSATAPKAEVKEVATPATEVKAEVKTEAKAEKPGAAKKAPAKKAAVKKETAKKAPAEKATAAKKTSAKKAELKCEIEVQFAGKEYTTERLVEIAKEVWQHDHDKKVSDLANIKLYVKPEESKVYYVMNDISGDFDI